MTDFVTVFMAVFLAEIAKSLIDRYWKPRSEQILDRLDAFLHKKENNGGKSS